MEGDDFIKENNFESIIRHPTEPKCPVVLLLDTSGSMAGEKIGSLNNGINLLINTIKADDMARKRIELSIVEFSTGVNVIQDFSTADGIEPVELAASGFTSMGHAILKAIDMVEERKQIYKSKGIDYYRPWIWLITDGEPTDMGKRDETYTTADNDQSTGNPIDNNSIPNEFFDRWDKVVSSVHDGENDHKFAFFAVGVDDADMQTLSEISVRTPLKLKGLDFKSMFIWLSKSLSSQSRSSPDEQISLPPPGWGSP